METATITAIAAVRARAAAAALLLRCHKQQFPREEAECKMFDNFDSHVKQYKNTVSMIHIEVPP